MNIERHSKTIWIINNKRIDTRKCFDIGSFNSMRPLRKALMVYYRNKTKLSLLQIDTHVCRLLNTRIKVFEALEHQSVIV